MVFDASALTRQKTLLDYSQLQEEFEARKQLAQQQMAGQLFNQQIAAAQLGMQGRQEDRQSQQLDLERQKLGYELWNAQPRPQGSAYPGLEALLPGSTPANAPLSMRNNNPGNMRPVGQGTGFQQFDSPQAGLDAMRNDLLGKVTGRSQAMGGKPPTLANIISTWAPPTENDTPAYIAKVSREAGILPSQVLTPEDIDRILPSMINMEGGSKASQYFTQPGVQYAQNTQSPVMTDAVATNAPIAQVPAQGSKLQQLISQGYQPYMLDNKMQAQGDAIRFQNPQGQDEWIEIPKTPDAPAGYRYKADGSGEVESVPGFMTAKTRETKEAAIANLPNAVEQGKHSLKIIDELLTHPGFKSAVGFTGWSLAAPGSNKADFRARLKSLKGKAFLEAYQQLKGGGAISEAEGAKAEAAIATLDTTQSEEQFTKSLTELRGIIASGIERAAQQAGQPNVATPQANKPAINTTPSGISYKVVQ